MQLHVIAYCKFACSLLSMIDTPNRVMSYEPIGFVVTITSVKAITLYIVLIHSPIIFMMSHWTLAHGLLISGFASCHCHSQIILQFIIQQISQINVPAFALRQAFGAVCRGAMALRKKRDEVWGNVGPKSF